MVLRLSCLCGRSRAKLRRFRGGPLLERARKKAGLSGGQDIQDSQSGIYHLPTTSLPATDGITFSPVRVRLVLEDSLPSGWHLHQVTLECPPEHLDTAVLVPTIPRDAVSNYIQALGEAVGIFAVEETGPVLVLLHAL
ncbi:hypothetical protein AB205_0043180 [Aquarana catesbeiana]|uniref:Uncharacterized protein n=1 Tax=Aquarana catesbeiana TaxID=8400 RepID=A0A2G9SA98_AQUCT|nr:hypothetical protein AB205_0043180 [Aquarana catesbeiana]